MASIHGIQNRGNAAALLGALLLFVLLQVAPRTLPEASDAPAGGAGGPCLPSCESSGGVYLQHAAALPAPAAVTESLKRLQYDGPDRRQFGVSQQVHAHTTSPLLRAARVAAHAGRFVSGSDRLYTLLCTYRL